MLLTLLAGCHTAMSQSNDHAHGSTMPTPWPFTFKGPHAFATYCYNTQRCRVIYNNHLFARFLDTPTPAPASPDYRDHWYATYGVMCDDGFPPPAQVDWTAHDGAMLHAQVDINSIFKDRRILHNVPREEIPEGWKPSKFDTPDIFLEVNDRTVSVYMRDLIATKGLREPNNPDSNYRSDVVLAWTHTY
jgi:hypothetical protein